ncbi:MAG: nickel-dependent lactate racemase [Deltaproteobacteria bacterium]
MKNEVRLRYGTEEIPLPPAEYRQLDTLVARTPPLPTSPDTLIAQALARPVGSLPLSRILRPSDSVAIAISDVTRYSATEIFLPHLLRETDAAGVPRNRVTLFVARGTHRALTGGELEPVVGPELSSGIRVEQSDPDGEMTDLGTTSRGTPVRVYRPVLEHDRVVLTGTVSFHYFAGFGGGRKALVPGCSARETASGTHFRIFRTDGPGKHPMARSGILAGNPVHEDLVEAVAMAPPAFLLNTLLTPDRKLFDAVAGHWQVAHEEGCARYARVFRVRIPRRYPLVIASAGGYPKDINFIQAHKALDHAFHAVEEGGVLILLAACPDRFGSEEFFPWFRFEDPEAMERELRANYRIYGQTAHAVFTKAKACTILLVSSLRPEEVRRMGMVPSPSLPEAIREAARILGELPATLVIPDAGYLLPEAPEP